MEAPKPTIEEIFDLDGTNWPQGEEERKVHFIGSRLTNTTTEIRFFFFGLRTRTEQQPNTPNDQPTTTW